MRVSSACPVSCTFIGVTEPLLIRSSWERNVSGGIGHQCPACENPDEPRKRGFATR
jgi:hypothetical protein